MQAEAQTKLGTQHLSLIISLPSNFEELQSSSATDH